MDKQDELRLALCMLPMYYDDETEDTIKEFFPHLSEAQVKGLRFNKGFNFAVPNPDNPNEVLILEYYAGMSEEEAEFDRENCEDAEDEEEEPACIFFAAKIDIRTQNTWSDDVTGSKALFIDEAIDWQLSRQTNSCK